MTDTTIDTSTTTPAIPDTMTPAEAATTLAERRADASWGARVTSGDGPAVAEFRALIERKNQSAADRVEAVLAGTAIPQDFELTIDGKLNTARLIQSVDNLREIGVEEKQLRNFMTDAPISKSDREWVRQYEKQLTTNSEFVKRYLSGEAAAVKEMTTIRMHLLRPISEK